MQLDSPRLRGRTKAVAAVGCKLFRFVSCGHRQLLQCRNLQGGSSGRHLDCGSTTDKHLYHPTDVQWQHYSTTATGLILAVQCLHMNLRPLKVSCIRGL